MAEGGADEEMAGYGFETPLKFTFGEMESRLARLHDIASDRRTQFQARLRNFQRLGLPRGGAAGRGKTVYYGVGQVIEMALAVELTQLGLLPERVVDVFNLNKMPISQAFGIAARALLEKGGFRPGSERRDENFPGYHGSLMREGTEEADPLSMFLYFDPSALAGLMVGHDHDEDMASASFFYGGAGIVRENIVKWTAGPYVRRLAFINVTALLWELIRKTKAENQAQFCQEVDDWADLLQDEYLISTVPEVEPEPGKLVKVETPQDVVKYAELLKSLKGLPRMVAEAIIKRAEQMIATGKKPPADAGLTGKRWEDMSEEEVQEEVQLQLVMGGLPDYVARQAIEAMRNTADDHRRAKAAGDTVRPSSVYVERTEDGFAADLSPLSPGTVHGPKKPSKRRSKHGDRN